MGPCAPPADRERLLAALLDEAGRAGRRVTAVQLDRTAAELHTRHGFTVNQFGASFSIALDGYGLGGQRMVKVRNMVNRARREGVTVTEVPSGERHVPDTARALDAIDRAWLRGKGRHVKELDFLIGERDGPGAPHRRLFTARHDGRTVAYVSYSPVFGERAGWLYDLTRRLPDAPPGTVELIFATALRLFQEESCGWLHLGFTPFVQLRLDACAFGPTSGALRRAVELIAAKGQAIYPAATQESFKLKWRPPGDRTGVPRLPARGQPGRRLAADAPDTGRLNPAPRPLCPASGLPPDRHPTFHPSGIRPTARPASGLPPDRHPTFHPFGTTSRPTLHRTPGGTP
ncbi:hypothetical protein GCM10020256_06510 [Streptomyces thermocoprophilus]